MNLNGLTWLLITCAISALLYLLAKSKGNQKPANLASKEDRVSSKTLSKLQSNLAKNLPEFDFVVRKNHITVKKNSKKLAMITLDEKKAQGSRKLGDVVIFNYHKSPSYQNVLSALSVVM